MSKKSALLVVDVQNDFCEGGSLAVPQSNEIIPIINKIKQQNKFDLVVNTCDWHPSNHVSFSKNHPGKMPFTTIVLENGTNQQMWPVHCQADTKGAEFHDDLYIGDNDIVTKKGQDPSVDSYSGFGSAPEKTILLDELKNKQIEQCFVVGLATDFCVSATALDSALNGFNTYVILDAIKGINPNNCQEKFDEMKSKNIQLIEASQITSLL